MIRKPQVVNKFCDNITIKSGTYTYDILFKLQLKWTLTLYNYNIFIIQELI